MAGTPGEDNSDFPYDRGSKLPRNVSHFYHLHCVVGTKISVLITTSAMFDSFVVLRTCMHILYFVRTYLSVAFVFHNKQHWSYHLYILYSVHCNSVMPQFKTKNAQNFIKITIIIQNANFIIRDHKIALPDDGPVGLQACRSWCCIILF